MIKQNEGTRKIEDDKWEAASQGTTSLTVSSIY